MPPLSSRLAKDEQDEEEEDDDTDIEDRSDRLIRTICELSHKKSSAQELQQKKRNRQVCEQAISNFLSEASSIAHAITKQKNSKMLEAKRQMKKLQDEYKTAEDVENLQLRQRREILQNFKKRRLGNGYSLFFNLFISSILWTCRMEHPCIPFLSDIVKVVRAFNEECHTLEAELNETNQSEILIAKVLRIQAFVCFTLYVKNYY